MCKRMNLQFFAASDDGGGNQNPSNNKAEGSQSTAVDYSKIQQMLNDTLAAKEDTALKEYLKKQGLSQQEAEQAITEFKTQKAANQPNVEALQQQAALAQQQTQQAVIERDAYLLSGELGVDLKTMPYLLKMADLSAVAEDGKVDQDKLKEALNKVLEELPQLKPQKEIQQNGFRQIGVGNQQQSVTKTKEQTVIPTKKWNRWN